mmetsp:Transcript_96908/g.273922  ORF Transcript_96908/g.273922 Transcript_96908/m.273922 type:complete len:155 (-) Transcript_96908:1170-1634(-)
MQKADGWEGTCYSIPKVLRFSPSCRGPTTRTPELQPQLVHGRCRTRTTAMTPAIPIATAIKRSSHQFLHPPSVISIEKHFGVVSMQRPMEKPPDGLHYPWIRHGKVMASHKSTDAQAWPPDLEVTEDAVEVVGAIQKHNINGAQCMGCAPHCVG